MKRNSKLPWKDLHEKLKKLHRYGKFDVMFYRTNDLIHSRRVAKLLEYIAPFLTFYYPTFDLEKAKTIALHHDDFEIVLEGGDISLQLKLLMDDCELSVLEQKEILASLAMTKLYPKKIKGYEYRQILLHSIQKDCIEAQVVSFCDKIDAYCEAIHEVFAGNTVFLEPIINYDLFTFPKSVLEKKYNLISKLFNIETDFFKFKVIDIKDFFDSGKRKSRPYTKESVKRKTLIPHYEIWKKITIQNFGIEVLIDQKEFQIY